VDSRPLIRAKQVADARRHVPADRVVAQDRVAQADHDSVRLDGVEVDAAGR
jgi:hypothetical protein